MPVWKLTGLLQASRHAAISLYVLWDGGAWSVEILRLFFFLWLFHFPDLRFFWSFSCSLPLWNIILYILVSVFCWCSLLLGFFFCLIQIFQGFQMVFQNQSFQINVCVENKRSIVLTKYLCRFLVKILQHFGNWQLKKLVYKRFYRYILP